MDKPIRIVIADDFPMFREGIHLMLSKDADIAIVGEANDGDELVDMVHQYQPDVVITDIEMPKMNGIAATREIRKRSSSIGIIALTMFGEDHLIIDMLEAGANGYLLKSSKKEELIEAIESVKDGGTYFCNSTSMRLSKLVAKSRRPATDDGIKFSDKEIEIIQLICAQHASKEIASQTNLTLKTVEKYRNHILEKTGSKNVVGVVIYAITKGIFKP